jgi:antitoxin PrlF
MNEDQFLIFLQNDIANHPERLQAVDAVFFRRINSLVGECADIDLDAPLPGEVTEETS